MSLGSIVFASVPTMQLPMGLAWDSTGKYNMRNVRRGLIPHYLDSATAIAGRGCSTINICRSWHFGVFKL